MLEQAGYFDAKPMKGLKQLNYELGLLHFEQYKNKKAAPHSEPLLGVYN